MSSPFQLSFGASQVPVNPCFRNAAVNTVAVVPLLSSNDDSKDEEAPPPTHSVKSFEDLLDALIRHCSMSIGNDSHVASSSPVDSSVASGKSGAELLLLVRNSSLTRPGDWRYQDTPLKAFHWQHGCQRLQIHDGRPAHSRHAYDRLLAASVTRDWIDLCPSRRTAAVIGVLNMHDCRTAADLSRACEELQQWANRYSTPPYAATARGRGDCERDTPVTRLFVYDSFDEESQKFDLAAQSVIPGTSILAFPPTDEAHQQMMDLHLNLVVSDLTVAIFRDLEQKIQESLCLVDSEYSLKQQADAQQQQGGLARRSLARFVTGSSGDGSASSTGQTSEEPAKLMRTLGIGQLANLVNPESKLAKESPTSAAAARGIPTSFAEGPANAPIIVAKLLSKLPPLLTPLDDEAVPYTDNVMGAKDAEAMRQRDIGRREKFLADLCLLAGSPLDAYEHYLKAAELCKTVAMDPLWHASALVGCAAAHIAMAEAGGYGVDEYLENNFQLPEEIMAMAREDPAKKQSAGSSVPGKQTLPEVVFVLCDEALNILNRHEKLGHLYAELLLKLSSYCADEAESHLRCRWGEGPNCYSGEQGDEARWNKTSVSKLKFNPLRNKEGDSMIAINTHSRIKKLCALLGVAASVGSLDAATRMDVAIRCARICLDGVVPTFWKGPALERIKLPRKAAFFVVMAAEAASGKDQSADNLWCLASRLYTISPNPVGGGGDYGWATLRAICFDSLAVQGNSALNLEAAEQLLSLLSELDPVVHQYNDAKGKVLGERNVPSTEIDIPVPEQVVGTQAPKDPSISRATMSLDEVDMQEAFASASQFAKNIRVSYTSFTGGSPLLAQQSKWAVDDPIPSVCLPLSRTSLLSTRLIVLKSVWPAMEYEIAKDAQRQCLERIWRLRRTIPTPCVPYGDAAAHLVDTNVVPFYVSSSMIIHCEPHLDLEFIQQQPTSTQVKQDSMATFFNPFAKKKSSGEPTTRVADGEERAMIIQFGNRLSLAIEIHQSHLVFEDDDNGRAKASNVSFSLPAKASSFEVHFPFVVLPDEQSGRLLTHPRTCATFNVTGVGLTFLGRSLFLPINAMKGENNRVRLLAESASTYVHRSLKSIIEEPASSKSRVEVYPCQPKLEVHFGATGALASAVAVALSDGELYTIPVLRISNCRGFKQGKIERLEICSQGRKLFDSNTSSEGALPEDAFVHEMLYGIDPPPLKVRALTHQLSVDGINDSFVSTGSSGLVTLQIAAAHNFGQKIQNGAVIEVVFRYRGACTYKAEVWRKHCVTLNIVYRQGPFISSLSFRPDLADGGVFVDSLNNQLTTCASVGAPYDIPKETNFDFECVLNRVGLDPCVSVCGTDAVLVLDVTNVTTSSLSLRRLGEPAGGFATFSLDKVMVHPGVSVKIPVLLPRISRIDENGSNVDVLAELVRKTTFVWDDTHDASNSHRGYIRIPPACLTDVVRQYPAFISQICQPPCGIHLMAEEKTVTMSILSVAVAQAIRLEMEVSFKSWVVKPVRDLCILSLEFRCVRKTTGTGLTTISTSSSTQVPVPPSLPRREFTWVGKMVHTWDPSNPTSVGKHQAKIVFLQPGTFVVSACARIARRSSTEDADSPSTTTESAQEIWWAPTAQTIVVNEMDQFPTQ